MISGRPLAFLSGLELGSKGRATGATGATGLEDGPPNPGAITILVGFLRGGGLIAAWTGSAGLSSGGVEVSAGASDSGTLTSSWGAASAEMDSTFDSDGISTESSLAVSSTMASAGASMGS